MSERAKGYYWTQWGTNPHWDVLYWRDGYFWDASDCGYGEENFAVGPQVLPPVPTHRHKKRCTEYVLLGIGKMQAEHWHDEPPVGLTVAHGRPVDMREVAIYRSVDDGSLWVRPREEFEDGRFHALTAEADGNKPS